MKANAIAALLFLLTLSGGLIPVAAAEGTVQVIVGSYGAVHGQLVNAAVQPNGTVTLLMQVNDQLVTTQGAFPITATATWVGTINRASVTGQIRDVAGAAHICLMTCQDANFVGQGDWAGALNGSEAAGDLSGHINFTNSPVSQIPVGQPIPLSGHWNASLQIPTPELPTNHAYLFLALALLLVSFTIRKIPSKEVARHGRGGRRYALMRKSL